MGDDSDAENPTAAVDNSKLESYYIPVASVGANLGVTTASSKVGIYWDVVPAEVPAKYGWTATPTFTNEVGDIEENSVIAGTFYMPENDKKAETETTTTGDRLNKKDKVSFLAGPGAPDATCQADVEIELGAATLAAAGSIALAAALSF